MNARTFATINTIQPSLPVVTAYSVTSFAIVPALPIADSCESRCRLAPAFLGVYLKTLPNLCVGLLFYNPPGNKLPSGKVLSPGFFIFGDKIMNTVAMKVNSANLVRSLKFSFTNKTTVLGELMQNARRAKATQVVFEFAPETKILRVTDDGCGIDSIETLLTVAESGWDTDVVANEHPFGIGFLSALFACNHITVVSKSGRLCVNTDDILKLLPVTVKPVTNWNGITSITMTGVDLELNKIESMLKELSRGFNIPVIFNGENLDRKHALDSGLRFVDTEIGAVYLSGVDIPDGVHSDFEVYLQGLPVYSSYSHGLRTRNRHVIHLDSACFYARLPDREKLIDEEEAITKIKTVLTAEIEQHFMSLKPKISAEDFVLFYGMMRHWRLLSLLNDVPVVPREALCEFADYPVCDTDVFGEFINNLNGSLTRAEIDACEVVAINDDMQSDGATRYMFAWQRNSLIYQGGLDDGHWIHPMIRDLNTEELTIELVNETHSAEFQGDWVWVGVRFCDTYRIQIGNDRVEMTNDALFKGSDNGNVVIMPSGDASGFVLKQISSYKSEYEEFQESTHEADMDAFSSFVVANTASDPADAMQRLLPGFSGCPSLYGKSFVVILGATGSVTSVIAAVS